MRHTRAVAQKYLRCRFKNKQAKGFFIMRILQTVFILVFLCFSVFSFANDARPGSIKGTVKLNDGKPAAYVSVMLKGSSKGMLTDENGAFQLRNVAPGTYDIEVSLAGYQNTTQSVTVSDDATATVTFTLNISEQQLEEVVVRTGRNGYKSNTPSNTLRLNEPLNEVPQNIQIITNKVLADQQITSLSDGITRNVSGLTKLEHWGDMYARINMRGGRAAAFRNGMNITSTWGPLTEDMSFVDHVEFVKGPAGFMMSNGDPSGIYNVVTKKPTGETKGEASILLGSYDLYRTAVDLDGKLSKDGRVLYRLNMMGQTKNSFRDYEYNNRYSIAPVISYKIDDNTTLTAEYIFQHAKMSDVGSYYLFSTKGYEKLPRNTTLTESGLAPTVIDDHNVTVNLQHSFNADWKMTAQVSYFNYKQTGSSMWLSSIDSAGNMVRNVGIWDASSEMKFGQFFVNGNVQTGSIRHRILGGLDMGDKEYIADFNQSFDLDTAGTFNIHNPTHGTPVNGYPQFDRSKPLRERVGAGIYSEKYTGFYLQDEMGFFDNKVRLTVAARYTAAKLVSYSTPSAANRFTPRFGLSADIDKQTSVYALFDQSFLPQSGVRRDSSAILPVTGNNIEVGIKKDWFGGKWNTSVSAYRILQNNQALSDPTNIPNQEFYVVQFGQTKTQGVELDVRGQLLPGLNLIANYSFNESVISKDVDKSKLGQVVPGYAKHTANAWVTYRVQTGALSGFGISSGFTYLADRTTWSWGPASQQQPLPNYFKLEGGLSYEKDRITITANVFNVLDKYLYTGDYYSYGGYYDYQIEAGRNYRMGVTYRF